MHVNPEIEALLARLDNRSLPGIDLSLDRMWQMLAALGNPQDQLPPVIHVAGTNGKGSVMAYLQAIYQTAGYRVHRYTSPHLVQFNERIQLAGETISDTLLKECLTRVAALASTIPVTFFEATTAAAFLAFSQSSADLLLLEVGMGGRLDATNVMAKPLACVITPIAIDHAEFLGSNLEAIATEKAGILKSGVPCICGPQFPEAEKAIRALAQPLESPLCMHDEDWSYLAGDVLEVDVQGAVLRLPPPALPGLHQCANAALAVVTAYQLSKTLPVEPGHLQAIASAYWPARLQRLEAGPLVNDWPGAVYLDGGHNAHAAEALAEWIAGRDHPVVMVLGLMQRKDAKAFLAPLAGRLTALVAVGITGEYCHPPHLLAQTARDAGVPEVHSADSPLAALTALAHHQNATVLIAGSLFLAGEVLKTHR